MKKKYSDPLMMSTILLSGTNAAKPSTGGSITPPGGDDDWEDGIVPAQPSLLITPAETPAAEEVVPEADPEQAVASPVVEVPDVTSVLDNVTGDTSDDIAAPDANE